MAFPTDNALVLGQLITTLTTVASGLSASDQFLRDWIEGSGLIVETPEGAMRQSLAGLLRRWPTVPNGPWTPASSAWPVDTTGDMSAYEAHRSCWMVSASGIYSGLTVAAGGTLIWNGGTAGTAADWYFVASPVVPDDSVGLHSLATDLRTQLYDVLIGYPAVPAGNGTIVTPAVNLVVSSPSGSAATGLSPTGFTATNVSTFVQVRTGAVLSVSAGDVLRIAFEINTAADLVIVGIYTTSGTQRAAVTSGFVDGANVVDITAPQTENVYVHFRLSDAAGITGTAVSNIAIYQNPTPAVPAQPGIVPGRLDQLEQALEDMATGGVSLADFDADLRNLFGEPPTVEVAGVDVTPVGNMAASIPASSAVGSLTPHGFVATGTYPYCRARTQAFAVTDGDRLRVSYQLTNPGDLWQVQVLRMVDASLAHPADQIVLSAAAGLNTVEFTMNYTGDVALFIGLANPAGIAGSAVSNVAVSLGGEAAIEGAVGSLEARLHEVEDQLFAVPATRGTPHSLLSPMAVTAPVADAATGRTPNGYKASGTQLYVTCRTDLMTVEAGETIRIEWEVSDPAKFWKAWVGQTVGGVVNYAHPADQVVTTATNGVNSALFTLNVSGSIYVAISLSDPTTIADVVVRNVRVYRHVTPAQPAPIAGAIEELAARVQLVEDSGLDRIDALQAMVADFPAYKLALDGLELLPTTGIISYGSSAAATMPALDLGTADHSISLIVERPAFSTPLWSNVVTAIGEQFWWNTDGSFTLIIGNGSNLTTHRFTTSARAQVAVGTPVRLFVTIRRSGDMVVFVNGVPLMAEDGTVVFTPINSASAQTVSSGGLWRFGSDGTRHYPLTIYGLATFEVGVPQLAEVARRKSNPSLWRRSVYRSKLVTPGLPLAELTTTRATVVSADDIGGEDTWLKLALAGDSTTGTHYVALSTHLAERPIAGDDLRVELTVHVPATNTLVANVMVEATNGSQTATLIAANATDPAKGYPVILRGSAILTGWTSALSELRFYLVNTSDAISFSDSGSTEAIYIRDVVVYTNGVRRIIDFGVTGPTKPDLLGINPATTTATDLT